jgi:cysteine desulfurase/selenocysteine lyase
MADELARVCIRSGHHCAMPLHAILGAKGSCRASAHLYNNEADIEAFLGAVKKIMALA